VEKRRSYSIGAIKWDVLLCNGGQPEERESRNRVWATQERERREKGEM